MRKLQSLKVKIPFFVMLLVTVMTIILVTLIIRIGSQGIRSSSIFGFESTTKVYARMINVWLEQSIYTSEAISRGYPQLITFLQNKTSENRTALETNLKNAAANNDNIEGIVVLDSSGSVVADSLDGKVVNSSSTRNFGGTELWQKIMSGQSAVLSTVDPSPADNNKYVVKIFSPIKNSSGSIVGAISTMIDWLGFIDKELNLVKFGNTGHPFVVDPERWVIADPVPSHVRNETLRNADYIQYAVANESGYYEFKSPFNGKDSIATFYKEPISGWSIVMSIESDELFSHVNAMKRYAIIGTIAILILASIFIVSYMHKITSILHLLAVDLIRLSKGDISWYSPPEFEKRKDEFGEIAVALKNTLDQLNE